MHVSVTIGQASSCFHVTAEKSVVTMKSAVGCNANWSWTNDNVFHEMRLQDPSSRISDSMFFELCKTLN